MTESLIYQPGPHRIICGASHASIPGETVVKMRPHFTRERQQVKKRATKARQGKAPPQKPFAAAYNRPGKGGIYLIAHLSTGMVYVGSSRHIAYRLARHQRELRCGNHHNQKLQSLWDCSTPSCFRFEALELLDDGAARDEREQHWILHFVSKGKCLNRLR